MWTIEINKELGLPVCNYFWRDLALRKGEKQTEKKFSALKGSIRFVS